LLVISFNVSALIGLSPMDDAGTLPFRDPVVQDLQHRSRTAVECDLREWQIPVVRKKSIRAA